MLSGLARAKLVIDADLKRIATTLKLCDREPAGVFEFQPRHALDPGSPHEAGRLADVSGDNIGQWTPRVYI